MLRGFECWRRCFLLDVSRFGNLAAWLLVPVGRRAAFGCDIGHLDEDGFLFIEDRLKDMILRGGANVYCAEVESVLYEHPAILEAAVCGLPDERLGESVAAVVVLRHGAHLDEEQLTSFLATRLAPYKIPTRVVFTSERLPTNGAGKISKINLAQHYFPKST